MTLRPCSPSFFSCSSFGDTVVISCMIIEAEMYGMMPSAKIAMRSTAPPANMLNMPTTPALSLIEGLREGFRLMPGIGNVGAQPIDQKRTQREPDALFELFGLGESFEGEV
jgi:hypothetical protein